MLGLLAAGVLILVPLGVAWCLTRAFLLAKRKPRRLPVLPAEFGLAEPQLYNIVSDSSKPPAQRTRVAVVGSGPAGCMAAWLLAAAGRDVTVIEAHGDVGGRMRTVRTPHGKWIVQVEAGADSYTRGSTLTAHLVQKLQLGRDEGEVDGRTRFFLPTSNTTEAGSLRRATFNPAFFVSMLTAPLSWANRFRLAMYWFRINLSRQAVDWYGPLGHVGRDTASSALAEAQKRLGGDVAARVVTPLLRTLLYADPSAASAGWVEALIGSELLTDRLTLEGGMDSLCRELLGLRVPGWRDDETSDTDVGTIGGTGPREASDGDSHKGTAAAAAASAGEGGAGAGDSSDTSTPAPPRTQQEEAELDLRSRFPNVQVRANCRVLTAARVKGSARLRLELLSSKRGGTLNCGDFVPPEDHLREPERSTLEVDEIVIATPAPVAAGIVKGLPKGTIPEPVQELLTSATYKPVLHAYYLVARTKFKKGLPRDPIMLPQPEHEATIAYVALPCGQLGTPAPPGYEMIHVVCSTQESARLLALVDRPIPFRRALKRVEAGGERFLPVTLSTAQLGAARQVWQAACAAEPWLPGVFDRVVALFGWHHGTPLPAPGCKGYDNVLEAFVSQKPPVVFAGDYLAGVGSVESALRSGVWAAGRLVGKLGKQA